MGIPLFVICCFSHAAFNICSFCLIFISLINMCLGVFHIVFILFETLGFLDLGGYFFPHFRDVFNYYLINYFLMPFLFVFFWGSCDLDVGVFNIIAEFSKVAQFLLILFFLFSLFNLFPPFYLPPHLSYLLPELFYSWFPPECF